MKIKSSKSDPPDVDMTPMIDIVFQLIAFFMVITNFEQTQADERVKLPRDTLAKPPTVKREDKLVLNIGFNRDKQGNIIADDTGYTGPLLFIGEDNVRIDASGEKLAAERAYFETIETPLEDVTVELRADAIVPTGDVQKLIQICQEQQFQRFALKATQNRD